MSNFINLSGMVVLAEQAGVNAEGKAIRVEKANRPTGSTMGVVYVRVFVDGAGVSTEQFSGARVKLADKAFKAACAAIVPADKPARVAKPAPETVLFDQAGVVAVMVTGSKPRFEIRRAGAEPEVVPATAAWRAEQKAVVARAQLLAA